MGISEDALAMKAYIEEHGWTQGFAQDDYGRVCIVGAHHYATGQQVLPIQFIDAISDILGLGDNPVGIIGWNDTPGRTEQEVLDMLSDVAIKHQPDEMRSNPDTPTA